MRPWWRLAAASVAVAGGLAALATGHAIARTAARAAAARAARTAAAYLAIVTPPSSDTGAASYDLVRLLVQSRGLGRLPGWAGRIEVYQGTAPLIRAADAPLSSDAFTELREREATRELDGAMVAPLKDRDDWDVVGAVAVRPAPAEPLLAGWNVVLIVLLALAGALALEGTRPAVLACGAVVTMVGLVAYLEAVQGQRDATDRWLGQTGLLLEEAAARFPVRVWPPLDRLARLAPGSELAVADSGPTEVRRVTIAGVPRAEIRVRLGFDRWVVLRDFAGDANAGGWLVATMGLAALGSLGALLLGWIERSRTRPRALRETLAAWGFLAPATLHLVAFSFGPMLFAVYLALHRWSPIEPARPFVGLANFVTVASDPLVWISLRNTILYTLHVPVAMAMALGMALLLRRRSRATRLARTVYFLPYVSSAVAIALVWQWMYHPDFGLLNYLIGLVGIPPVDWLGDPRTALLAVMLVSIWVQVGYQMVVFQAGLQGIPRDYLDAALVDGADAWRRFWRVTFPLLRPVTLFVLVTGIITSFQVFTLVYVLTDGGPLHATDVLVYRIYQMAWEFLQFGPASALALLLFALLFAATWIQFRLLGRQVQYG
ncbi:MAG TPA: sugar ABC transporter permease [Gemmatimonadales bacterium]|nr:sugar ABC transporter permease [Gemmatimonadales bacterium]